MKPQTEDRAYSAVMAGLLLSVLFISVDADADIGSWPTTTLEEDRRQIQMDRNGLQLRQQQQMYQEQRYDNYQQQQNEMYYQQQRENMRNQGYGRPGLDGGWQR